MSGLPTQLVPFSFGQGIDTKPDKKQQHIGKLRRAKNVVFETLGSARKRNGYEQILLASTTGNTVVGASTLTKYKNELNLLDSQQLYSFSEALQKLQPKGALHSVMPASSTVLNDGYNHAAVDAIVVENLKVFVSFNTSLQQVVYSVQDALTGSLLISNDVVETTGAATAYVRVAHISNYVYIIYASNSLLKYRRFSIATPGTLQTAVSLASNADATNPVLDTESGSGKIIVVYRSGSSGTRINYFGILSDGTATSINSISTEDCSAGLTVYLDSSSRVVLVYSDNSTVKYSVLAFNLLGAIVAPTLIETIGAASNPTVVETTPGNYKFYYEILNNNPTLNKIRSNTGNLTPTAGTPTTFLRSVGTFARAFVVGGNTYIPVHFRGAATNSFQCTYFIARSDGALVAKVSPGLGMDGPGPGVVAKSTVLSDTAVFLPSLIRSRIVADNGTFFSPAGIQGTVLDFAPTSPYSNALLGEDLHIAGGILQMYDGDNVVEHGFNAYPELIAAGSTATSGGHVSDGDYGYIALYRWTDNGGQDHFSAVSRVLSVSLSGGTALQTQAIVVPTLRLTSKSNVIIEVYRTENNGEVFFEVTSDSSPIFNDPAADSITFTDTLADDTIVSNKPLYTTGGVLDNIAPSAASIVAVHTASNRIVLAGPEQPNVVRYSKQWSPGFPVEFNDELVLPIDPVGGPITQLASMDEKLVVFERSAIFYVGGQGPNDLGQQDTFTPPELVDSEVGCTEPRSLVLIPQGFMFKSSKGIFLLDRGLGLSYIGAEVEEYNSLSITSAKVIAGKNQVRFTTSNGDCLVYNYHLGLWCTFTNHQTPSAEVLGDNYYYIRSDTALFKESATNFSDNGVPIKLYLETAWMNFSVFQGFQRVRKAMVVGDYKSAHQLRFRVGYNYNEAYVQDSTIDPAGTFIDAATFGTYSPYGEPATRPFGGIGRPYQARFDFAQQKCQAIKFIIEDIQTVAGEGLSLSGITFEIAGKNGLFKIDGVGKFGVS